MIILQIRRLRHELETAHSRVASLNMQLNINVSFSQLALITFRNLLRISVAIFLSFLLLEKKMSCFSSALLFIACDIIIIIILSLISCSCCRAKNGWLASPRSLMFCKDVLYQPINRVLKDFMSFSLFCQETERSRDRWSVLREFLRLPRRMVSCWIIVSDVMVNMINSSLQESVVQAFERSISNLNHRLQQLSLFTPEKVIHASSTAC